MSSRPNDLDPSRIRRPEETDLADPVAARRLVAAAFPPLRGDAAVLVIPARDGCSDAGVLIVVDDVPERPTVDEAGRCIAVFAAALGDTPGAGLLIAVQRRGEAGVREADTVWVHAARAVCTEHGLRLLGVWLVAGRADPMRLDA